MSLFSRTPLASLSSALAAPAICLLLSAEAMAFTITNYSAAANNRFGSDFLTNPTNNTNASYVGAGYDLTGVGWVAGSGSIGEKRVRNATLFTPLHVSLAEHYPVAWGSSYLFLNEDNALYSNALLRSSPLSGPVTDDMLIGTLTAAFSTDQKITPYRVLDTRNGGMVGMPMVIYGSEADNQGPRIGLAIGEFRNRSIHTWVAANSNATGAALYWDSGDSGSPAFVAYTAPDGTKSLTLVGPALGSNAPTTFLGDPTLTPAYSPAPLTNNLTKLDGYAIKWTIYDKATDTAQTAPQWTGAGGTGTLGSTANWRNGLNPANLSVLFDAGAANGATTLTVDSATSLRGALFKASASNAGFTFNGTSTLTLGYTGLRNESTATQTFNIPVILGDSQNWEAANGNLVFNGAIDTTAGAHLVIVGGARDTTFNGILSGAGALAKDDSGILTLNTSSTYTGKTWIHGGTLRLGTGSLPTGTEVIFQTTNAATLDLNGNNQTIAGLKSVYGGTGQVHLGGATLTINNAAADTYAGDIIGTGGLTKNGEGLLILAGSSTYTGVTTINTGTLRAGSATALSATTNLVLAGGILELGGSNYSGTLGTGAGQVQFGAGGGFSAFGGTRSVNLGGEGAALTWGDPHFVQAGNSLVFSATTATGTLDFQNALVLGTSGSGSRTVHVNNGSASIDARLSGALTAPGSTFGLTKSGAGTLELTGTNTYTGATILSGGALRIGSSGALSSSSNVVLSGGVLELGAGNYTAALGTEAGQVRFAASGGFSAAGANRSVNLGGSAAPVALTWGDPHFLAAGSNLILSSVGSDFTVDFQNAINFGATGTGTRTVQVDNGSAAIDARLSGGLTDSGTGVYSFSKTGAGTLELTGTSGWHGSTKVEGGVLRMAPSTSLPTGNLVLSGRGVLELTAGNLVRTLGTGSNQVTFGTGGGGFSAARSDRIVYLNGGAALAWGGSDFVPTAGSLVFSSDSADATVIFMNGLLLGTSGSGDRSIIVNNGSAAVDARITGDITSSGGSFALSKSGAGTLELTGNNSYSSATWLNNGVLRIGSATALSPNANIVMNGGILELGATDLSINLGTGAGQIQAWGTNSLAFSASGATRNLTLNGGSAFGWGIAYDSTKPLVFSSASSDATINFTNAISLTNTGPVNRVVQVNNGSAAVDARLSGVISQAGEIHGLTKTGAGTLELTAANTYKGATLVAAGTLHINGNQSAATGDVVVASGATLGGSGRIGGATFITSGGTLELGAAPRLLTFESTLIFDAGSIFIVTLNKGSAAAIAGTDYDKIVVGSTATLNDTQLSLNLTAAFVATAEQGTVFTILTSDGLIGNTDEGSSMSITLNGTRYDFGIGYTDTDLTLTLQNISAVPEPATAVLIAALVIGAFTLIRKRRSTAVSVYQP